MVRLPDTCKFFESDLEKDNDTSWNQIYIVIYLMLSLECNDDFKDAYLDKIAEIKATLELKPKTPTAGIRAIDFLVNNIVNLNSSNLDELVVEKLPFHNRWSSRIFSCQSFEERRKMLDPKDRGMPVERKAARSSITQVFQFQSMLDLVTSYEEAGKTYDAMLIPFGESLRFRNIYHSIPECHVMSEFFEIWLDLPIDPEDLDGYKEYYEDLIKTCDNSVKIPWKKEIELFLPEHYDLPNLPPVSEDYTPPPYYDCRREIFLDGERMEIDCTS